MSSFGVLTTGFNKKLLSDINTELSDDIKDAIDPNLNTSSTAVLGQMLQVFAAGLSEEWDVLEAVYNGKDPDTASGAALAGVGAITGALVLSPTESTVTLVATGDDSTLLATGRRASVQPLGSIFQTLAPATIVLATVWTPATSFSVGDRRSNDTPTRIYEVTIAGTSAGSGGPTGTGIAIVDNSVTWRFLGEGEGFVNVACEATVTGPVVGQAFTITTIDTPVTGWIGVNNVADAVLGTDIETDAAFRIRREALIRVTGKATLEAVRAALLNVAGVTEAIVFENTALVTVGGIPGKAFEAVVLGGTEVAIAQSLFDTKPLGIQAFGTDISELIVDSQGTSHTIEASRPDPMEIFIDVTVTVDGNYPLDGDAQVAQALKDLGDALQIGDDVIFKKFECEPFDISGVVDITLFEIDKQPAVLTSGNAETYALSDGETLLVRVDGGTAQTATFNTGDFADIGNATAAEVAAVITTDITGATAADAATFVAITSTSSGSIAVTGGTANGALGFATTFNPTGVINIPIASRQLATFDTSRILVTSV